MNIKTKHINYSEELNSAQLEAVMFNDGPLLVIAGAGSGKTRTLTYRVARLVEDGVPSPSILLLTFTRKASQEMLSRACKLLKHLAAYGVRARMDGERNTKVLRIKITEELDP